MLTLWGQQLATSQIHTCSKITPCVKEGHLEVAKQAIDFKFSRLVVGFMKGASRESTRQTFRALKLRKRRETEGYNVSLKGRFFPQEKEKPQSGKPWGFGFY